MREGEAMREGMNAATDEATNMSEGMIAAMTAGHIQGGARDLHRKASLVVMDKCIEGSL